MDALIVTANPDPDSLTARVAGRIADGLRAAGRTRIDIADLTAEGFDPRFGAADRHAFRTRTTPPADVLREQQRVDRAEALFLVFPVYWWSMPALLKGWIDRVFSNGWAYTDGADGRIIGHLRDRPVHLIALAAGDAPGYERHGYAAAMETQITYGIFHYCGLRSVTMTLLHDVDSGDEAIVKGHLDRVHELGRLCLTATPR
ncbi:NAD(P)H-dependent oxidoreductase [Azospirillum halopraeferens]|uniref:NAD(P)H-dependent oxidoreductase n=1 Tax=Azospirillum halopraeferens TaxID=34010 RepID=UPI000416A787|nr:NAD(P)H-dependent oxidoreductase [Azospirillum halopraeferens]